ncbi:MAG: hypothetical protein U1E03_04990 [Hyphomonadaceae bacterium]
MALLSIDQVRDNLADPSLLAQNLDFARQAILFLKLDSQALNRASFLDDRILSPQSSGRWVQFSELDPWLANARQHRPLHFIFHAGHVGSTLLSRLLDDAGGVLGLREPLGLRVLADAFDKHGAHDTLVSGAQLEKLLTWHLVLWSRGYGHTQQVVLKATSAAARLHERLLKAQPSARAVYLNLDVEPYLATLLAGENSPLDLRGLASERFRRFVRLQAHPSPTPLHAMSLGEIAAMTWATERLTQRAAEAMFGDRVLSIDFDTLLRVPADTLRMVCRHFGIDAPESYFQGIPENPILTRYSKAPEHAYTPALRAQILAQSREKNRGEIGKGLAWIANLSAKTQSQLSA